MDIGGKSLHRHPVMNNEIIKAEKLIAAIRAHSVEIDALSDRIQSTAKRARHLIAETQSVIAQIN
jgi:ABC-type transporter Mla subunit MlaD